MAERHYWCVEWHDELDSTMDRASDLARAGAANGTVVVADFQRQGRGTHGRVWHAPSGTCLMFTLLVRPNYPLDRLSELPLRAATSLAELLGERFHLPATVKLPNDILIGGKKVCGVLCTSRVTGERLDWVLCGVGLNTAMTLAQLPSPNATSLRIEGVADLPPHAELLEPLLARLEWLRDL